jgi:hypothetical protein
MNTTSDTHRAAPKSSAAALLRSSRDHCKGFHAATESRVINSAAAKKALG